MNERDFLQRLDEARIVKAIADAEDKCSGEVRVYVSHKERHNVMEFAKKRFSELGMTKTRNRNGVLLYIVPRTQQFAVLGDVGIHEKCGDEFWRTIASGMSGRMKAGQFTEAIVEAIAAIGNALARHFPPDGDNPNELPNRIVTD